jgi:hypothetical protein
MRTASMTAATEIVRVASRERLTLEAAAAPIERLLDRLEWVDGGNRAACHAPGPSATVTPGAPRPGYHRPDCAIARALGSPRIALGTEDREGPDV